MQNQSVVALHICPNVDNKLSFICADITADTSLKMKDTVNAIIEMLGAPRSYGTLIHCLVLCIIRTVSQTNCAILLNLDVGFLINFYLHFIYVTDYCF